jgi:hypothetical protein
MKKLLLLALWFAAQLSFAQGIHSGIVGESVVISCPVFGPGIECPPYPYQNSIFIYSETGRLVKTIITDEDGLFAVRLNPGIYTLVPAPPPQPPLPPPGIPAGVLIYPLGFPVTVEVEFKEFTTVTIIHDSGAL